MDNTVAELVAKRLPVHDRRSLRLVCRSVRDAVRRCFTHAKFAPSSPALRDDVLVAFPLMTELSVSCRGKEECLQGQINRLAACSPALLANIGVLKLDIAAWSADMMHALASRCSSLSLLRLSHPHFTATFTGASAAPDPAVQLRHQLATPAPTPTLLYPASPAARNCLTDLTLSPTDNSDFTTADARSIAHPTNPSAADDDDYDAFGFDVTLLPALPHLNALTRLTVHIDADPDLGSQDYYSALEAALPHVPQLRVLCLRGSDIFYEDNISAPRTWAPLTNLTRLAVCPAYIPLDALAPLCLLRRLRIAMPVSCVTSLYPLTALTSLSLGDCRASEAPVIHDIGSLTTDMPQHWRMGLKRLVWVQQGVALDNAALALLQGLTRLNITSQTITHEFVWALAQLPRLQKIKASDMVAPQSLVQRTPPQLGSRPALKALVKVTVTDPSALLVNLLATWTQLPASCRPLQVHVNGAVFGKYVPCSFLRDWSPCWLRGMLRYAGEPKRCFQTQLFLLFLCEQDVDSFCAAAASRLPFQAAQVHVGPRVSQAALLRLVAAVDRLFGRWSMFGWGGPAAEAGVSEEAAERASVLLAQQESYPLQQPLLLTAAHVRGLPVNGLANLTQLSVDCRELDGAAMGALLAQAPELTWLKVAGVGQGCSGDMDSLLSCLASSKVKDLLEVGRTRTLYHRNCW